MSAELSGMVHDCPMTVNQSIIEEIGMINCSGKKLKFFAGLPLTSGLQRPCGCWLFRIDGVADIHCFIRIPAIQNY
ncbi:hypothetical protein BTK96_002402 [Burkholderia pyrrocinia]|uniref:hypothetical protein n=1 Tax=Burkholderia TaxID=32008 RepID=UPI001FB34E34|nr:hypothetical protein [Burkholderia pyrrocinia]EKS9885458.1 hypothetical protein [Burkholderia pyrrocinia]EKS9894788.1 hypothetical protein [Burkholderia pyrrocinia]EKS9907080.1 hypothetical protein [Burkholderia pyrrocinia]UOB58731.1 hypothetical protein MRS60_18265 [Burkholderia pyrrocinia]